jgi:hypothetical protein
MLDHFSNQASGLIGLGCQPGPRLVAMVNHGDQHAELPLLWQLCLSLVNFGYSVTVLDATTAESNTNPGLEQLFENALWDDGNHCDTPAWTVLPCANGIQTLLEGPGSSSQNLHRLGPLLPTEGIVVLYCKVEWMVALMGDRHVEPLMAVSPVKTSLLTSYMALKRLLITGTLKPTIVNMLQEPTPFVSAQRAPAATGLSACAKRFLGHELKTLSISAQKANAGPCGEVQRLALRLLESAVPLALKSDTVGGLHRTTSLGNFAQFAGSH